MLLMLQLPLHAVAQETSFQRRKDETVAQADRIFGERYTPVAGKPMRLFDKQTETRPPDAIIYWHGSSYVIELVFAADGTIAKLVLLPEDLLYSDNWSDVPNTVELSVAEIQWLVASANVLQPLGKAENNDEKPNFCFVSGPNQYCYDAYQLASVNHNHVMQVDENQVTRNLVLRDIEVSYRQSVSGIVEDARVQGGQRHLEVSGQWYHGEKPGIETFEKARIGSVVRLITYGCAGNEKTCVAVPEQSKSALSQQ